MQLAGGDPSADNELTGLRERRDALRQTASLRGARLRPTLEAVLAELDAAIDMLAASRDGRAADDERQASSPGAWHAERRLLRSLFADAPVPLFLIGQDGIVRRANRSAGDALGTPTGYAAGKPFAAFLAMTSRAAVDTQLSAVIRTGKPGRIRAEVLTADGAAECELTAAVARLRGDDDQLIVGVSPRVTGAAPPAPGSHPRVASPDHALVAATTRRVDLATTLTREMLTHIAGSEALMVQRCAQLLARELADWVVADMARGERLQRQFVAGPEDQVSAALAAAAAELDPAPESLPWLVHDAGSSQLIAHAEDAGILGDGPGGVPLLMQLDATSLVSVPVSVDGHRYGVLTLARRGSNRSFDLADLGLMEELAVQLGLAARAGRQARRQAQIADALRAAVLPPAAGLPAIPGVEVAAVHVPATDDPEVGGDFYDAYRTPAGWGVAIGAAAGRGEGIARAGVAARHAIRLLARSQTDPAAVLGSVNEVLSGEQLAGRFVTACTAHLRWRGASLEVTVASAGHPGPVLVRQDGQVSQLAGGGLPLGIFPDAEVGAVHQRLSPGDVMLFVTEGVTDARGPEAEPFAARLSGEVAAMAGQPPGQVVSRLQELVLDFCGDEVRDDLTMLAFRVGEPPPA